VLRRRDPRHSSPLRRLDRRALVLLLLWCVGVLVPPLHIVLEDGFSVRPPHHREETLAAARAVDLPPPATLACAGGRDCHDPRHHRQPLTHTDPTACPICSSHVARLADPPAFLTYHAPCTVRYVDAPAPRLSPVASRQVISLARGPPSPVHSS
jgi:hypothetical protein